MRERDRSAESFDVKLRDELLNGEIFYTFREAGAPIVARCVHDNTVRLHSALWIPAAGTGTSHRPRVSLRYTRRLWERNVIGVPLRLVQGWEAVQETIVLAPSSSNRKCFADTAYGRTPERHRRHWQASQPW